MNYFSMYIPKEHVADIKRAILPAIHDLQESIFANNCPGHENKDCRWSRYITMRDLYLCLEGADKAEKGISVTPYHENDNRALRMHREATFDFPENNDEEED